MLENEAEQPENLNINTNILENETTQDPKLRQCIEEWLKQSYTMNDFLQVTQLINSKDLYQDHHGVIGLRKILSVDYPPIQSVIDANLVPLLISFMKREDHPHLQLEAAWALTNVASGSSHQTQTIIDKGGIPLFVKLLKSKFPEVAEQAIWAIGNISGDCASYRDMIIKEKAIEPLINIILYSNKKNNVKHGTWALSNIVRSKPNPNIKLVESTIPCFSKIVKEETDPEVLSDALWSLSYLTDEDSKTIQKFIDTGVIPSIVRHLSQSIISILIPTIRILGNVVTGSDDQTNVVLESKPLDKFFELLNHEKKAVRKEVLWALSNIAAGNADQIAQIITNMDYVKKLVELCKTDLNEIKREASWVLSNATNKGYHQHLYDLVKFGILELFVALLDSTDVKTISISLEAIKNLLKCGDNHYVQEGENTFLVMLESLGGVAKIEGLQTHSNNDVYKKALEILETYFDLEDPL